MEKGCYCDLGLEPIYPSMHLTPKARKDHKCDECGGEIPKGTVYHVHKGLCDGRWLHVKNCQACEAIRDDYGCGCIGELDEVVSECLGVHINRLPD
jgi:hypothetical protein